MTRRLRLAGTALSAFLVPACSGIQPQSTVIKPAPVPPGGSQRLAAHPVMIPAARGNSATEKFADNRSEATPSITTRPVAAPDLPLPRIQEEPLPEIAPVEHRPMEVSAPPMASPIGETPRLFLSPRNGDPTKASREPAKLVPEPVPDAEGVIRASWPVLKGTLPLVEPTEKHESPPIPIEPMPLPEKKPELVPAVLTPPPSVAPPTLPPGVIGSTTHQSHASPVPLLPDLPPPSTLMKVEHTEAATTGDSPLLRSFRLFQQNRPDEAVNELKSLDPATQQILLSLMPALVQMSDGKLGQMKPEELDVLLDKLTQVPLLLKPRASLQANNVRLCREVHNFGHVDAFAAGHTFRPGDIVYLYQEMNNFSCVAEAKGGFAIDLTSALEIKNSAGVPVWRADPKETPDRVSSSPQDYYRNFRMCVPSVPPGTYTVVVKTTDRPTGREVTKSIEMQVGPK